MPPERTVEFVLPNKFNAAEMQLAFILNEVFTGQSVITSHAEDQIDTCAAIQGGLLGKMRGAFRENILTVVVPLLEQLNPEKLLTGNPKLQAFLVNMRKAQARKLAAALREAGMVAANSEEAVGDAPADTTAAETALNEYIERKIPLEQMCRVFEENGMALEAETFRSSKYRFFCAGPDGFIQMQWKAE